MANELTGMTVKIKADIAEYISNMGQVADTTDKTADRMSRGLKRAGDIVAGIGVAFSAAAATAVKSAMDWGNAVDDLSDKTGLSGEKASELLVIAKRVGIGTEQANQMFARFSRSVMTAADSMSKASASGKQSDDVLTKLGVSAVGVDGQMRNTADIFRDVRDRLREMPDGLQKTSMEMDLFGRSGAEMHDMLMMSNTEIDTSIEKARALGLILSSETAAAWEQLNRDMNEAKGTMTAIGVAIGNEMMPKLRELLGVVNDLVVGYANMDAQQKENINSIIRVAAEIGVASLAVKGLEMAIGRSLGPWGLVAVAIWEATGQLREWNIQSQQAQRAKAGGKYVIVGNHTEFVKDKPEDFRDSVRGAEINMSYGNWGKEKPAPPSDPYIPPGGGGGGGSGAIDKEQREAERIAQINKQLTDELNKLTMDDLNYKLWANEEWRKDQIALGGDSVQIAAVAAAKEEQIIRDSANKEFDEYVKNQERIRKETEDTAAKKRRLIADETEFALDMGAVTEAQYIGSLWNQYDELKRVKGAEDELTRSAYRKAARETKRYADDARREAERVQEAWADALSGLATGDLSGKDLGKSLTRELSGKAFQKMLTGKSSGGGLLGDIFGEATEGANQLTASMGILNTITSLLGLTTKPIEAAATTAATTATTVGTVAKTTETTATAATTISITALGVAAASAAAALASVGGGGLLGIFEKGGIVPSAARGMITPNISGGIPSILHRKEMVLPRDISEFIINAVANSSGGGRGQTIQHNTINISNAQNLDENKLSRRMGRRLLNLQRGRK